MKLESCVCLEGCEKSLALQLGSDHYNFRQKGLFSLVLICWRLFLWPCEQLKSIQFLDNSSVPFGDHSRMKFGGL